MPPSNCEDPREAVADGRPAHGADVQGPGRVRRDELEVHRDALRRGRRDRSRRPASTMTLASAPAAAASSRMLMKPGPATSTARDAVDLGELGRDLAARVRAGWTPSGLASFMAMLDAQSPCSRVRGRSSGTSVDRDGFAWIRGAPESPARRRERMRTARLDSRFRVYGSVAHAFRAAARPSTLGRAAPRSPVGRRRATTSAVTVTAIDVTLRSVQLLVSQAVSAASRPVAMRMRRLARREPGRVDDPPGAIHVGLGDRVEVHRGESGRVDRDHPRGDLHRAQQCDRDVGEVAADALAAQQGLRCAIRRLARSRHVGQAARRPSR